MTPTTPSPISDQAAGEPIADRERMAYKRISLRVMAEDRAEKSSGLSKTIIEVLDYLDQIDPLDPAKPMLLLASHDATPIVDARPVAITCPNCRGVGTTAGATYTYCSMCNKTGKITVKRPGNRAEEFKAEWITKYGFPPTDNEIFNAGMLAERVATRDAAPSDALKHDAWKEPFAERHEFDNYPDHFMTGLRNEFAAGWHAAIKAIAAIAPMEKT